MSYSALFFSLPCECSGSPTALITPAIPPRARLLPQIRGRHQVKLSTPLQRRPVRCSGTLLTIRKKSGRAHSKPESRTLTGLYPLGKVRGDDHQQEAGIVAGEAAIDSVIVAEVLKMVSRRERPTDGTGQGRFFNNGSVIN